MTEAALKQKLQENRRELKRRVESLRTFLWTILEVLDFDQTIQLSSGIGSVVDFAKGIESTASQISIAEQMLEQLKDPRVRARVQAIDEFRNRWYEGVAHKGIPA